MQYTNNIIQPIARVLELHFVSLRNNEVFQSGFREPNTRNYRLAWLVVNGLSISMTRRQGPVVKGLSITMACR